MEKKMYFNKQVPPEIAEHMSLLYNTAHFLNSSLDVEEVLNIVIDMVIEVFESERGFVMLFDKAERELKIMTARNMDKENISDQDLSISMSVANKVFETGVSILSTNATLDPTLRSKSILLNEIRSILCVPMKLKNEIIGVIYTDNRLRASAFDDREKELLAALADQAATAIENARLYKRVSDDYKKIQLLERVKAEFISLISHELRTPLVPIKGYIYTLKNCIDSLTEEEKNEIFDTMEGRVEHLSRLINDILSVTSIDTDSSMHLFETKFNLTDLFKEIVNALKKKYPTHLFTLNLSDLPDFCGDEDKLSHAFYHIIDNGAKFSPLDGKVDITVACISDKGQKYIDIDIKDNGIGIAKEYHKKIFDKFYQVDASSTRAFEGIGIGLYIANYVVEAHKGIIGVESNLNEGSLFKILLPLREISKKS